MLRKIFILVGIFIAITSIAACDRDDKNLKPTNTPIQFTPSPSYTNTPIVEPTPTQKATDFIFPKEGVRPVAVMIDNEGKRVLPQGGLNKAQLVYEITVEGGETRLMPVFWGTKPTMIGPVRSSRHYYLDYVMEHDAIYVHFGWSPMAMKDISKFKINNINGVGYGGEVFWDLTKDRRNWQDSYTSMDNVMNFVKKAKYKQSTEKKLLFSYNQTDEKLNSDNKANKVTVKYNSRIFNTYEFDPSNQIYKKSRNGDPHMERVSQRQLEVKNIIVQHVPIYGIKGDDKGRQDLKDVGSGNGWFVSCGNAIKIKWSKKSRTAKTNYTDESGKPIVLNPGLTWIQIVPINSKVIIE
ncbi:DUF3048 domain-containing protein [Pseudobacteroides cellulosolvens]|uniref:DUF3048 domain-containing protein n=1 Tax=Pseudobacteroides cellulosolvens ATCC 35603 = DSM 2933 TaxID=398512 RepID=A0A0L6JRY8_9FIRM|nr:DUF3048 domain-containing protein [Pseudobacteroides cellulosolvens]KNY28465.1 Protein of unknown function DUF3048 [Pseudobacteroides cellulosolvens ATCC 35603 = DSM 2933]